MPAAWHPERVRADAGDALTVRAPTLNALCPEGPVKQAYGAEAVAASARRGGHGRRRGGSVG
eukprot:10029098-Alexandrium_andersonii.AAC.1